MDTVERYYCTLPDPSSPPPSSSSSSSNERKLWGEIQRGLYLIRGENVAYLGEIDLDLEDDPPAGWEKVEVAARSLCRLPVGGGGQHMLARLPFEVEPLPDPGLSAPAWLIS